MPAVSATAMDTSSLGVARVGAKGMLAIAGVLVPSGSALAIS
jgi:hypothetical protein